MADHSEIARISLKTLRRGVLCRERRYLQKKTRPILFLGSLMLWLIRLGISQLMSWLTVLAADFPVPPSVWVITLVESGFTVAVSVPILSYLLGAVFASYETTVIYVVCYADLYRLAFRYCLLRSGIILGVQGLLVLAALIAPLSAGYRIGFFVLLIGTAWCCLRLLSVILRCLVTDFFRVTVYHKTPVPLRRAIARRSGISDIRLTCLLIFRELACAFTLGLSDLIFIPYGLSAAVVFLSADPIR